MSLVPGFRRDHMRERAIIEDAETGVKIAQLTSFPTVSSNLYFHSRSFSPDGKTVLFTSMTEPKRNGIMDLYAASSRGDDFRQLTEGHAILGIALHPAGRFAYYAEGRSVYEQDVNTGEAREFVRAPVGVSVGGDGTMTDDGAALLHGGLVAGDGEFESIAIVNTVAATIRIVKADFSTAHLQIEPGKGEDCLLLRDDRPAARARPRDGGGRTTCRSTGTTGTRHGSGPRAGSTRRASSGRRGSRSATATWWR